MYACMYGRISLNLPQVLESNATAPASLAAHVKRGVPHHRPRLLRVNSSLNKFLETFTVQTTATSLEL